jgi:hypothetical protein
VPQLTGDRTNYPAQTIMLQTIQGIYRNGKVELAEIPQDITESQVFVTFFKPQLVSLTSQFMSFGMFSGSQQSTDADFRDAEFNGDIDDALGWV